MPKLSLKKYITGAAAALAAAFAALTAVALYKKPSSVYDDAPAQKNPLEGRKVIFVADENDKENADGVKGHLESVGFSAYNPGFYERYIKRACDVVLSFGGLVVMVA